MRALPAVFMLTVFAVLHGLSGCGGQNAPELSPEALEERGAVMEAMEHAEKSDFLTAFESLSSYAFNRYIRTEQYDAEDYIIAYDEHLLRTEGEDERRVVHVERTDSAGAFDFGFFSRFVSENVESADPVDLIPYVLPEDRAYDDPRSMDKYRFRFLADTLLWDRQARVIEIRARPELADGLNVRLVRQYVDIETGKLVGVYLERIDLALLFREESAFYVDLRPGPGDEFLPYNTRFETRIRMPFRQAYKIRTVSTFSAYEPSAAP
jgi:hypothetical protein